MLGTYYSASLPAYSIIVDADIKGDLIYFYSKGSIHSFDMHCRGLTTHYHGEHWAEVKPYWVMHFPYAKPFHMYTYGTPLYN